MKDRIQSTSSSRKVASKICDLALWKIDCVSVGVLADPELDDWSKRLSLRERMFGLAELGWTVGEW